MKHLLLASLLPMSAVPAQDGTDSVVPAVVPAYALDSGVWTLADTAEEVMATTGTSIGDPAELRRDTVAMERRHFDTTAVGRLAMDPELDYDRVIKRSELWWDRFLRWLSAKLERLFGTRTGTRVFANLHWIILGIALLILAWFLRGRLFGSVFAGSARQARTVTEVEEDIAELDLPQLLAEAERAGNWRLAIRFQWLSVLKRLVDDGHIRWQPRYTDADYLAQLQEPALRATFSELSFLFKWVWYGDAPMDRARYEQLRGAFIAIHRPPGTTA